MHNYIFDAATNGLLLQAEEINPVACKEPRPVYAEEMDLLGFDSLYRYSDCNTPLLWAEQRRYIYRGVGLARLKGAEFVTKPELVDDGE